MVKRVSFARRGGAEAPGGPVRLHRRRRVPPRLPARPRARATREFGFRDEDDYISKYRRVLDHFDAVKIGLTATPALHTKEIFGAPVFYYSLPRGGHRRVPRRPRAARPHRDQARRRTASTGRGAKRRCSSSTGAPAELDKEALPDDVAIRGRDLQPARHHRELQPRRAAASWRSTSTRSLAEKTLVFCATDEHADMVVALLKEALRRRSTAASTTTRS